MKLEGIHHVTCITGDAPGNVDFYAGTLGLRLVKKTVNQDDPTVYHLFYADERGSAGSDITFFEYPGLAARPRGCRDGAPHRVPRRVERVARLLAGARRRRARTTARSSSRIPEGLALELVIDDSGDEPLVARHPEIPEEHALRGFAGVRAYTSRSRAEPRPPRGHARLRARLRRARRQAQRLLRLRRAPTAAACRERAPCITSRGRRRRRSTRRGARRSSRPARARRRSSTASTSSRSTSASRAASSSRSPRSAPASRWTSRAEHLGERLSLPPAFEHLREQVEPVLTPLPNPRETARR